jgi:2'-5' RNA ligase
VTRLFVALDLPVTVRRALTRWAREAVGGEEAWRLITSENMHATLCFLGWREEEEVARIGELVGACAAPVPGLALGEAVWLPPRRPRVLAVDIEDAAGGLSELQERVSSALAREAGYEPERRPYRPHVTVARVRGRARVRAHDVDAPPPRRFDGLALTLYRSRLQRSGARYEPAVSIPL